MVSKKKKKKLGLVLVLQVGVEARTAEGYSLSDQHQ